MSKNVKDKTVALTEKVECLAAVLILSTMTKQVNKYYSENADNDEDELRGTDLLKKLANHLAGTNKIRVPVLVYAIRDIKLDKKDVIGTAADVKDAVLNVLQANGSRLIDIHELGIHHLISILPTDGNVKSIDLMDTMLKTRNPKSVKLFNAFARRVLKFKKL
jgi:hypothetical protein